MDEDWQADLERWLAPYLEGLGNKTRRRMCPAYIAGLIGPSDRKSIQPMAARSEAIPYERLYHFIGAGLWDSAPLEATLWDQADQLVGGDEAWLVGEHRSDGERKYYPSNLPGETPIKALAGAIKARWICEQAHQQLKEEFGLDHFEGRSWNGLHHHALMSMIAYAFLQSRRLEGGAEKRVLGPPPQPTLPAVRQDIIERLSRSPPEHCPQCGCSLIRSNREILPK